MKTFLLAVLICTVSTTQAQKFFKKIPKPYGRALSEAPAVTYEFRPVLNIASYAIGDNSLLNGGGVSYQYLEYKNDKWTSIWSINAVAWYKNSFNGDGSAFAAGITGGFFNDLIMVGVGRSFEKDGKFFATFGIGVNLNN